MKLENFAVDIAPVTDPAARRPLIEHDPGVRIEDLDAFSDYLGAVLPIRRYPAVVDRGSAHSRRTADGTRFRPGGVRSGTVFGCAGRNPEWATPRLRIAYGSFIEPSELLELDVATGSERTLLKRQPVLGGYDPADYAQSREWATAADGTKVPLSVIRRKDVTGPAPLLLYGYGSYESSLDPAFSAARLSMLDRGG